MMEEDIIKMLDEGGVDTDIIRYFTHKASSKAAILMLNSFSCQTCKAFMQELYSVGDILSFEIPHYKDAIADTEIYVNNSFYTYERVGLSDPIRVLLKKSEAVINAHIADEIKADILKEDYDDQQYRLDCFILKQMIADVKSRYPLSKKNLKMIKTIEEEINF